jgi:hypothetical protein
MLQEICVATFRSAAGQRNRRANDRNGPIATDRTSEALAARQLI